MKFSRIYQNISDFLSPGKVLVLYGPRQVGKTTLIQSFLKTTSLKYRSVTGDNIKVQNIFASQNLDTILAYVSGYELLVLDEAQKIPQIGVGLKMLVDHKPDLFIIATGSASFELSGQIGEPLTGRKKTLTLYPMSYLELNECYNSMDMKSKLSEFLIYGMYPEILTTQEQSERISKLDELAHSYLLKDVLALEKIKGSKFLLDLLRLLAFQIGNEVSLNEIASQLNKDAKTIARYIDLLEKSFVVFNLRGFSKNLRKEINKKSKYYFYDNGMRNAIIANFNPLNLRNDIGALWENFLIMERLKKRQYHNIPANPYFWRTWDKKEIDLIEEREGKLFGYEFKWNPNKKAKAPKDWLETYDEASYEVISQENFLEFVL